MKKATLACVLAAVLFVCMCVSRPEVLLVHVPQKRLMFIAYPKNAFKRVHTYWWHPSPLA